MQIKKTKIDKFEYVFGMFLFNFLLRGLMTTCDVNDIKNITVLLLFLSN